MKNMKMSKEEAKEYGYNGSIAMDAPQYPYGLRIDLDDQSLEKLGIDKLPEVGSTMMIVARVEVQSVSSNKDYKGEPEQRLGLQITDMELAADKPDKAKEIYG